MIANIDPTADLEVSLDKIERATTRFAEAHSELADNVRELEAALAAVRIQFMPRLRKAVDRAADQRSVVAGLLERGPHLFVKPRTITISGIKVGYQKGKGGMDFDDAEAVVARILKLFPEDDTLLHCKVSPNKERLALLSGHDLKRLGCSLRDAGDEIVIKPAGDVDKLVAALLKDASVEVAA